MPTIAEVRDKFPEYGDLSDSQLADGLHAKFYADMPRSEFESKIGYSPGLPANGLGRMNDGRAVNREVSAVAADRRPDGEWDVIKESPAPRAALSSRIQRGLDNGLAMERQIGRDRTAGTIVTDLGAKAASGANAMVGNLAGLYGLTTGNMDNPVSEQAKSGSEYWEAKVSPELKAQEADRKAAIEATDTTWARDAINLGASAWETMKNGVFLGSNTELPDPAARYKLADEVARAGTAIWKTLENPELFGASLAEQTAQLVPMVGAGKLAGVAAKALGAGAGAAGTAAVAGGVGAGAAMQGADTGGDAYDRLMALPDPLWAQNEEVNALVAQNIDPKEAKHQVALRLSRDSASLAAIASGALNAFMPGARTMEKVLSGVPVVGKGALGRSAAGAIGEGGTEFLEEGSGMTAQNYAVQGVNPDQALTEGMGEAAGIGALVGGGMGGTLGALGNSERQPARAGTPAPSVSELLDENVGNPRTMIAEGSTTVPGPTLRANMAAPPQVGDLVQWESNGQVQFEQPRQVTGVHQRQGKAYATVEGSQTGIPLEELSVYRGAITPITDATSPAVRGSSEEVIPEQVELASPPPNAPLIDAADELRNKMREPAPASNVEVAERELPVIPVELAPPPAETKPIPESPTSNIDIAERQVERIDAAPAPSDMQTQKPIENDEEVGAVPATPLAEDLHTLTDRKKAKVATRDARAASERYRKEAAINPQADDLLSAIAKSGGISREAAAAAGIDPADFTRRGWKIKRVFTTSGMPLEAMSEKLAQLGYPVTDEHGYGENPMLASLDRALRGEKLGTMQVQQDRMDVLAAERDAEQEMADPFGTDGLTLEDHEYDGLDSHGQQAVFDAMERARDAGLTDDEIEAITERAAIQELSNEEYARQIEQETEAKHGHHASTAPVPREPSKGARTEAPPALDSYTAEDLAALDKQKADAAAARAKQESKDKADDERGLFTLSGSDSTVDQAEARGQSNLFDSAVHEAATSPNNDLPAPTEAQINAGNYRKGHVAVDGLDISIENPEGSKRRPEWPTLKSHYGYIKRTEGGDGEHIDVFVKPGATSSPQVYVVDQSKKDGTFDEHKVMMGFDSEEAARTAYAENYTKGWKVGPITAMTADEFKSWLKDGDTTTPAAKPSTKTFVPATNVARLKEIPPAVARRVKVNVDQMIEGEGVTSVEATAHDALKDIKRELAAFKKLLDCVRA